MIRSLHRIRFPALILAAVLAAGCVSRPASPSLYDLGPLPAATALTDARRLPAIALNDARSPAWLGTPLMYYRLLYANDLQPRPYAESRWIMPPTQLLRQRLALRIADAGGVVSSSRDSGATLPVLQLDIDDFSHVFTAPDASTGRLSVRATVFNGRRLAAQRTFRQEVPASSGDAQGGALALSAASDALITDLLQWLATLPVANP